MNTMPMIFALMSALVIFLSFLFSEESVAETARRVFAPKTSDEFTNPLCWAVRISLVNIVVCLLCA
jgi:hypothetical protein